MFVSGISQKVKGFEAVNEDEWVFPFAQLNGFSGLRSDSPGYATLDGGMTTIMAAKFTVAVTNTGNPTTYMKGPMVTTGDIKNVKWSELFILQNMY